MAPVQLVRALDIKGAGVLAADLSQVVNPRACSSHPEDVKTATNVVSLMCYLMHHNIFRAHEVADPGPGAAMERMVSQLSMRNLPVCLFAMIRHRVIKMARAPVNPSQMREAAQSIHKGTRTAPMVFKTTSVSFNK